MYKTLLEGFPTLEISEKVELPNLAELLQMPMFNRATLDDAYKYGGENVRKLIDQTPLKHDKKFYAVRVQMQFIKEGYCPVNTTEWHCDGKNMPTMHSDDRTHIFVGDTSSLLTEFLEEPVIAEEDFDVSSLGHRELMTYFEENQYKLGFKPKFIEPNRFITMGCRHVHRVQTATKPDFRFFFEIRESDHHFPVALEQARVDKATVFAGNRGEQTVCLEHSKQWGVIIRDRY